VNRDVWEVFNFYEDLGYFVTIGAVRPYTAWRSFGMGSFAYRGLGKPVVAGQGTRKDERTESLPGLGAAHRAVVRALQQERRGVPWRLH
jgi:hypothetical protein